MHKKNSKTNKININLPKMYFVLKENMTIWVFNKNLITKHLLKPNYYIKIVLRHSLLRS